ncbi:MAG: aldo/keto reductase, partial [Stenotrophomonas maltophilia]|nr:aldo/keto reductase [Stenotrophomonas maltophilia]
QDLVLGADAGARLGQVRRFSEVARALGHAPATLAIAWCLRNPNVSSVILGASRVSQLLQNLQALDVLEQVDASGWAQVEAVFA